jgi:N-acyl-D-amino-acid deacylase
MDRIVTMLLLGSLSAASASSAAREPNFDLAIRDGAIYDGSGGEPFPGTIGVIAERIAYVGPATERRAKTNIDASGKAVAPGFINMLSWAGESLLADGRAQSDLRQGVTLEVFGEGESLGPWSPAMRVAACASDDTSLKKHCSSRISGAAATSWASLGEALETIERAGTAVNIASFIGAETVRKHVLGENDVDPTQQQLGAMQALVRDEMEQGALGVGSALIYPPGSYAETSELVALSGVAARCGGMYITHLRSESDRLLPAIDEAIEIGRRAKAPVEIYHLKLSGRANWGKLPDVTAKIAAARSHGVRVTTNMYTYDAAATGLSASLPPWVQAGGNETFLARLRDPAVRARVIDEMRAPGKDWENVLRDADGPERAFVVGFRKPALVPLNGKSLAEIAARRDSSAEDAVIDLILENGGSVATLYLLMSEPNVAAQIKLPYMSFGSDGAAPSAEGETLKYGAHPRFYGTFARLLGKYVRDERVVGLQEAVRRLTSLPARNLSLRDRGSLIAGYFADVVVFDPATIQDHATFAEPHRYATGVSDVVVNGRWTLRGGSLTQERAGQVVRGRAWKGWKEGGCRASAGEWPWSN